MDLFSLTAKLVLDSADFNKDLETAQKNGLDFGNQMVTAVNKVKTVLSAAAIGAAIAKIGKALQRAINDTTEYADAVDKGAQSLNISYKAYQLWDYALGQSGASVKDLGIGIKNLNAWMAGNATSDVAEAFESLGINAKNANGDLRSTEDVLDDVLIAIAGMEAGADRNNLITQLFGKSGAVLNAFFNAGREGIQQLVKEADEAGLIMSDEAIQQGVKTKDATEKLGKAVEALTYQAVIPMLPYVESLANTLTEIVAPIQGQSVWDWVRNGLEIAFAGVMDSLFGTNLYSKKIEEIQYRRKLAPEVAQWHAQQKQAAEKGQDLYDLVNEMYGEGTEEQRGKTKFFLESLGMHPFHVEKAMQYLYGMRFGRVESTGQKWAQSSIEQFPTDLAALLSGYTQNTDSALQQLEEAANAASSALNGLAGITGVEGSNAKGAWDIPYDMTTRVHANEMILNATQARQYREGNAFGGVSEMVAALHGLRQDMQNIQLVVGEKALGRATVQYGGRRMNGYIGRSESRVAAGYGWG